MVAVYKCAGGLEGSLGSCLVAAKGEKSKTYPAGMWRELVERFYSDHEFRAGASDAVLADAERGLGAQLPADLRGMLAESDGVYGDFGLDLMWPISRIVEDNLRFRTGTVFGDAFMPFDPLLFGGAGNGDMFAFPLVVGPVANDNVFAWNHEDDSRTWVAPDLSHYLEWWSDGRIKT